MKKLFLAILFFSFGALVLIAKTNDSKIDSILTHVEDYTSCVSALRNVPTVALTNYLSKTTNDLSKCKIYNALCWYYFNSNPPKAMEYAKLLQPLAEKSGNQDAIITSYDNLAWEEGSTERKSFVDYINEKKAEAEEKGKIRFFNQQ